MSELRRALVSGALCGGFAAAGLMFLFFWHIVTSAPNAGAMVQGQFRPYQSDPTWHLMAFGGLVLIAGGLGALAWIWRKLDGAHRAP